MDPTIFANSDWALSVTIHAGESGKKYWFSLFLLIKSKNYILLKDYFQVWTLNDQQIPLQHDDSYFFACRNAMGFRCILRLVAKIQMPKYLRITIFEGISY